MQIPVFLFLFVSGSLFSQVLDNSKGQAFTDAPFFNQKFIQNNKIKEIIGRFNYKKSGEAIYPTEYKYVYSFDSTGKLKSKFETRKDDGTEDTTWHKYFYNEKGALLKQQQGTNTSLITKQFKRDSADRITKENRWVEYTDSTGKVLKKMQFNSEKLAYTSYGEQEKMTRYNSYDLPYLEEIKTHNELGYLVERREKLIMTSTVKTYKYKYNDKGLLAKLEMWKRGDTIPAEAFYYEYDELDNLLSKEHYRKGKFITDTEIIYNSKSKLMTAVLIRDVKTDFIMIIRYQKYTFF